VPSDLPIELANAHVQATTVLNNLINDTVHTRDNLLQAKIQQTHYASSSRSPDPNYAVGDMVMLSTLNRRHEYKKKGEHQTAKLFPRWDGPYRVTNAHPTASTYTLDIKSNAFPVYHTSELKPHFANDSSLFPNRELACPGPILTGDGLEEFTVDQIIDLRRRGRGRQFLVRWAGYDAQHDLWIPASELNECEALDIWYKTGGDGPDTQ